MKRKIILAALAAVCAASCTLALASCGLLTNRNPNQNDPNLEPPVEEEGESLAIGVISSGNHEYGVVSGLGTITSTDIEIPATYNFGGEYGELPVESIMWEAFKDTAITSVSIPATVKSIGDNAFSGCSSLTAVTMADGEDRVTLGKYVFENCTALSSVTLSDAVVRFEDGAFKNCSALTSLTLPDNLQSIGQKAFEGTSITSFDVTGCEKFDWTGGLLINKSTSGGFIAEYANPEATEVIAADGVTMLEPGLFKNNKNIRTVDLNGTEIYIGANAFTDSSLEELLNYDNVTNVNLSAFEGTPWLENMLTGTENFVIGKAFLLYRGEDTVFAVPAGIEAIGARAFAGTDVKSVTLPDSVDSIGSEAFAECENMESVILEGRPPYLATDNIFPEQAVIYVPGIWLSYYKSDIIWKNSVSNQILPNPTSGLEYTLSDDETYYIVSYRSATGDVIIPESYSGLPVKAIRSRGFYGVNITGIQIPDSVTDIGDEAFSHCRNLKSITVPGSVTSMGDSVFESCTGLESVNVLYGISAIGSNTFKDCESLISVTLPDSVTYIGSSAFHNCHNLESVNIPENVTCIEFLTFYGCSNLKSIKLPGGVTAIGYSAFSSCTSLKSVIFENTDGWWVSTSPNETSGTNILDSDLKDAETAATLLTGTYRTYYWKRG